MMPIRLAASAFAALGLALLLPSQRRSPGPPPKAPPGLQGARVIAGLGAPHESVLGVFLALRSFRDTGPDVVVLSSRAKPKVARALADRGAGTVAVIVAKRAGWHRNEPHIQQLTTCRSLWLDVVPAGLADDPEVSALVQNVGARGGAIAAAGEVAQQTLAVLGLPDSELHFDKPAAKRDGTAAHLHWYVPKQSALVVHHRRRAIAYGPSGITVRVGASGDWPARQRELDSVDVYDFGDVPSYDLDLLAWQRIARDRSQPVFPPAKPPAPRVAKGALLLSGGGGVSKAMFRRFLDHAGGKNANIVCIPSASSFDPGQPPSSYSAGRLRELGANNVTVLHVTSPHRADDDPQVHGLLQQADGVWIDGGRTYRFMDAFQGTRAHAMLSGVLQRGGVVGGSSAGCQLIGDLLVRGNPRTNKTLVQPGYTRGLGLLSGVVVDAHFRQRKRESAFAELVAQHPQLLGIGLDESTAIWVEGSTAEVMGKHTVSIYDHRGKQAQDLQLREGDRIDLVTGKRRK